MEMLESQTIIAVAVIGAIASGLVNVIKAMFSRNHSKDSEYDYQLKLVEAVNGNNEVLVDIKSELVSINGKVDNLSSRIDRIEKDLYGDDVK